MMKTIRLSKTDTPGYWAGSDGAYYGPVRGVEARCAWCRRWGHQVGLLYRHEPLTGRAALVCGRHVRRPSRID
jgi:hypothetical protein